MMGLRIAFIAKHGCGGNNDEDAITHALQSLGHEVQLIHEDRGHKSHNIGADLVLFLKWGDVESLRKIRCPKVFWYFDLVSCDDPSLQKRCEARKRWMCDMTPNVDLGFLTDGGWVDYWRRTHRQSPEKLFWLPQGADERFVGFGRQSRGNDILFTGTAHGGQTRESFVREMREKYGPRFAHVSKGVHGIALRDTIGGSRIVVAPDGPISPTYWSNRVFLTLGFGGFLIHPYCEGLLKYYPHDDLVMYQSREQLHRLIEEYSSNVAGREAMARRGLKRTLEANLYRHRCEELLGVVKERLGVG